MVVVDFCETQFLPYPRINLPARFYPTSPGTVQGKTSRHPLALGISVM